MGEPPPSGKGDLFDMDAPPLIARGFALAMEYFFP
jgi:hypothetical protein